MRVLCLHGKGSSAKIFKSQTSSFRRHLSSQAIQFEFVDGPCLSEPAAGIELFYSSPYYCFWDETSAVDIQAAHSWLLDLIARSGPYDGVMMFSQGCALISSLWLYHQTASPKAPFPFKSAIFICGSIPLSVVEDVGFEVPDEAWRIFEICRQSLFAQSSSSAIVARGQNRWDCPFLALPGNSNPNEENLIYGLDFAKMPQGFLLPIPTVHIYGSKDPIFPSTMQLAHFCEPRLRKIYDHGGGHEIPRRSDVSRAIAELVEWSVSSCTGAVA